MAYYLGIDLGGTNIAAAVVSAVDGEYKILARSKIKTNAPRPAEEIAADMALAAMQAVGQAGLALADIEWVGIGSPGDVNRDTGVVEYSNNLRFHNAPIAEMVKDKLGLTVHIDNDANVAAYGEYIAGAAKGVNNAIVITLGTGVGCGVIIDGNIYSGFNFAGGELGHTVIKVDGYECTCGRRGCFEAYASAPGLIRMTRSVMNQSPQSVMHRLAQQEGKVSARTAFTAMRMGDEAGVMVVEQYTKYLAAGIINAINIFQPEVLCIGGGICNEGDPLLVPLRKRVFSEIYNKDSNRLTRLEICKLGNDAGIIGAAMLGKCTNRNKI